MVWKTAFIIFSLSLLACRTAVGVSPQPARTPLPTLTPTSIFYRWSASQVVSAIQAAGLESENIRPVEPEEYNVIPAVARQGVRFSTPSVCPNCGGLILSFDNASALEVVKTYYIEASAEENPDLSSWVFVKDNVLLQLSGQMPKAQALEYGAILVKFN